MGISPMLMNEIFNFRDNNNYNLRSGIHLTRPLHTTQYRTESVTNLGAKYGTWCHKILKKPTPYINLKARLRNGYQKKNCSCSIYSKS